MSAPGRDGIRSVRARATAIEAIREHARLRRPREVVGLLAADGEGIIVAARELGVGDRRSVRVPAAALRAAEAELTAAGLRRAGLYHSHLDRGTAPTEADRLAMRVGEPMLIVSLAHPEEVRAFALADDRLHVAGVTLEIV